MGKHLDVRRQCIESDNRLNIIKILSPVGPLLSKKCIINICSLWLFLSANDGVVWKSLGPSHFNFTFKITYFCSNKKILQRQSAR